MVGTDIGRRRVHPRLHRIGHRRQLLKPDQELRHGSVTFRLDEDSGATIASGNAPGLTPRTFDISGLTKPGGYLYLYNNGVLFFTYTIRVI